MSISKPYFRIIRFGKLSPEADYIYDSRYATDRYHLVHSYKIIEKDLKELFEYIEPADNNKNAFSHRLYELFLRCSTEFETNCKRILISNGYKKSSHLDIQDYYKINQATKLSNYEIKLHIWYPEVKTITPFQEWNTSHSLNWYQDYNTVKHDRSEKFQLANLSNVLKAAAGLIAILFAQFESEVFDAYKDSYGYSVDDEGFYYTDNSLFGVKPFENWPDKDQYKFDNKKILTSRDPFQQYPFK